MSGTNGDATRRQKRTAASRMKIPESINSLVAVWEKNFREDIAIYFAETVEDEISPRELRSIQHIVEALHNLGTCIGCQGGNFGSQLEGLTLDDVSELLEKLVTVVQTRFENSTIDTTKSIRDILVERIKALVPKIQQHLVVHVRDGYSNPWEYCKDSLALLLPPDVMARMLEMDPRGTCILVNNAAFLAATSKAGIGCAAEPEELEVPAIDEWVAVTSALVGEHHCQLRLSPPRPEETLEMFVTCRVLNAGARNDLEEKLAEAGVNSIDAYEGAIFWGPDQVPEVWLSEKVAYCRGQLTQFKESLRKRPREDAMLHNHEDEGQSPPHGKGVENALKWAGEAKQAAVAARTAKRHALAREEAARADCVAAVAAETAALTAARADCVAAIAAEAAARADCMVAIAAETAAWAVCAAASAAARVAAQDAEGKSKSSKQCVCGLAKRVHV